MSAAHVAVANSTVSATSRRKSRNIELTEEFEQTGLYKLLHNATGDSWRRAFELIPSLPLTVVRQKSKITGNNFLHEIVWGLRRLIADTDGDTRIAIVLTYRLAASGCDVNVQNDLGHTPLHMACFRPAGTSVALSLLRLGADPCIENNAGYRVYVDNSTFKCSLIKGQQNSYCSIWQAVQKEDFDLINRLMLSWFRVQAKRKRKTLIDIANETSNYTVVESLTKYELTNELVVACFACDLNKVTEFAKMRFDKPDFNTMDRSKEVPQPLVDALKELSPYTDKIVAVFAANKVNVDTDYKERKEQFDNIFTSCTFYQRIEEMTIQSVQKAWDLIDAGEVSLNAVSASGDNFLHFVVNKYCQSENIPVKRMLIRVIYKLALAGIDVNHRNNVGETVLISAFRSGGDRRFLDYLIGLGVDASQRCRRGQCISINTYATRGELVLSFQCQRKFLPGLWPAVEDNDIERTKFWLSSLNRVNCKKGGRNLLTFAKDNNFTDMVALLERHLHLAEFVVAALAADTTKMKYCLAMGQGASKVNAVYNHFFAGVTDDWKVEYVVRPILVSVIEMCPAAVTKKFIDYGVNLSIHYEEVAPCGPVAFWAFRDDIDEDIAIVIAEYVDLSLRDERGSTVLHRAILRQGSLEKKKIMVSVLLERGANVAAKDINKMTARDYCSSGAVEHGEVFMRMIDDYVLNMVFEEDYDAIEELIVQGYEHITDICGTARNKTAVELAQLKYYKELIEMLHSIDRYQQEIRLLHAGVITNNTAIYTKFLSEKKLAWGVDSRNRNILHLAVLYRHAELVGLICEQFPQLINQPDVLLRTPAHYAIALRDQRQMLSIMASGGNTVNLQCKDANNLSPLDYIEQLDKPTALRNKPRGRRVYNYDVGSLVATEKEEAEAEMVNISLSRSDTFVTDLGEQPPQQLGDDIIS